MYHIVLKDSFLLKNLQIEKCAQIKHSIIKYAVGVLILLNLSCKDQPSEPPIRSRNFSDYNWSTDTLARVGSSQTLMQSMWGSSSDDVYMCGYNDASGGKLYHFDGSVWREVRLDFLQRPPQLNHLHGTSKSDIWAVGYTLSGTFDSVLGTWKIVDSSFAMHFNGSQWQEFKIAGGRELTNVLAISQTDVWACGVASSLFHFNGATWTQVSIPGNYLFTSLAATSPSDVYLVGNQSESTLPMDSTGYYLFHMNEINWTKIDSVMEHPGAPTPHFGRSLWSTGSSLYSLTPGVFRKSSSAWVHLSDIPVGHMYQVTPSKIIAVGKSVYQFDGTNWAELTQFATGPGLVWFDCFADASEAFVIGNNNSVTVMLHGK